MSKTKTKLIDIGFEEIYQNGYHATSVDKILEKANIGKSSMYYYFSSKKDLVLAIINERVFEYIENKYSVLLNINENFLDEILTVINDRQEFDFRIGCKLNNLVQELSHKDVDFKNALEKVYFRFEKIFENVINNAIEKGEFHQVDARELSIFIVATIEGCISTAKKSQNQKLYFSCINQLELYLRTLRNI